MNFRTSPVSVLCVAALAAVSSLFMPAHAMAAEQSETAPAAAPEATVEQKLYDNQIVYYDFTSVDSDGSLYNTALGRSGNPLLHLQNGSSRVNDAVNFYGRTSWGAQLDGVDDYMATEAVAPTDTSFTVMASVLLTAVGRKQVVVGQENAGAAELSLYADSDGGWKFGVPRGGGSQWDVAAASTAPATAKVWTRLAGVYDADDRELRLYLNGKRVATAPHDPGDAPTGSLTVGRGREAARAVNHLGGKVTGIRAFRAALSDEQVVDFTSAASSVRRDRCETGDWLHVGGPKVKEVAARALAGTDLDRQLAFYAGGAGAVFSPLEQARRDDEAVMGAYLTGPGRYASIALTSYPTSSSFAFESRPEYAKPVHDFLLERADSFYAGMFAARSLPVPGAAEVDRALAIAADLRRVTLPKVGNVPALVDFVVPTDAQIRQWSAYRVERFLRYGGLLTQAPPKDSTEYRVDVESIKAMWAACDSGDPYGAYKQPYGQQPDVLAESVQTARSEWNAELASQAAQRNAIVAAELRSSADVRSAAGMMIESQEDAWTAGQILRWQRYWLARPNTTVGYPTAAQFTTANNNLATIKTRIAAYLTVAQQATASAKSQVDQVVTPALTQAAATAKATSQPVYRGLAYAQQSAQVTKASAAAAASASSAVEATLNAVKAANADSQALQSHAATRQALVQAEFRRAAALEAAAQARAAAVAAQEQANQAAAAATRAAAARATAEKAERTARSAAADAKQKRATAENAAGTAAVQKMIAASEATNAKEADSRAQQQRTVAGTSKTNADTAADTAAEKRRAAEKADRAATVARDNAYAAERRGASMVARAEAAEANAQAEEAEGAAGDARAAANEARAEANSATAAARSARAAATDATEAAAAANEAATRAEAAAKRSRAASDGAQADVATTQAQVSISHAAAAEAIEASEQAAGNVKQAQKEAATAAAAAQQARTEATAAKAEADKANAESARTAGWAAATVEAATAARDAALNAIAAASDAIGRGTPFQAKDISAGMAVLVGQTAKTTAEQQAAAAEVRANEAVKAAAEAKELAARATAAAKAAAEAAAAAAADASSAAQSLKRAIASAAAAAADAAAAQLADAKTLEHHNNAVSDAWYADAAADRAEQDARSARSSADAAEQSAASARRAATDAESDAAAARDSADRADRDATAAEKAADHARQSADEAQQAAKRTEQEAQERSDDEMMHGDTPLKVPGVTTIPVNINDGATPLGNCLQVPGTTYCEVNISHHITGYLDFYMQTCPDPETSSCAGQEIQYFLNREPVNQTFTQTHRIDLLEMSAQIWTAVAKGMVADYINCWERRDRPSCDRAVVAAIIDVFTLRMGGAARAVATFRAVARHSDDIEEGLAALRAADIDPATVAKLEREAAEQAAARCVTGHSFDADTLVAMADGSRKPINQIVVGDLVESTDPNTDERADGLVSTLFRHDDTNLTDVTVEDASGAASLIDTTQHHRFWDATSKSWVEAEDLAVGHVLRTPDGTLATVASVRSFTGAEVMFDLTVESLHAYYVLAGDMPVLVHNSNCWSETDDVLDAIHDKYGPRIGQGVEYMMGRYNQGAVGHALRGVGADAAATARYLAHPRTWTHVDSSSRNWVTYDSTNQILIIRTAQDIHAYNYTTEQWATNVGVRYLEPAAGTSPPAWP